MNLNFKIAFGALSLASLFFVGCQQTEEIFQERKTNENLAEIRNYIKTNKITADSTTGGMFFYFQKLNASGQKPALGDEITIKYIAKRFDGVVVDSSFYWQYTRVPGGPSQSYYFAPVPAIEDLMQTGTEKLHEGDQLTILVPWSLRTSVKANLLAPLYIPLKYEITILKIRTEEEQIEEYIASRKLVVTEKTASGLRFIRTLAKPDSAQIVAGNNVKAIYTGRLASNGSQFDAGSIPVAIVDPEATNQGASVVKGFNDGLAKMRWGEKAIVIFPSSLGYSTTGSGAKIKAYSPLVFELETARP